MGASRQYTVGFEGLAFDCIVGILERERTNTQSLIVDLSALVSVPAGNVQSDSVAPVDYGHLAQQCRKIATEHQCGLLETLALRMAQTLLDEHAPHMTSITIKLRKPQILPDAVPFVQLTLP